MNLLRENLNFRRRIVMGAGIWSGFMLLFVLATGVTDFGLGDTSLYVFERVYAIAAIILGLHVSARYNTVEKVPVTSSE